MPELLLELLSEEIPARMQRRGAADLERAVGAALEEARLDRSRAQSFASPRRLTLLVEGLPEIQPDLAVERKGPRADAPQRAIDGFLKSVGFDRDRLEERDDARGKVLYAVGVRKGRPTAEVLAEILPRAPGRRRLAEIDALGRPRDALGAAAAFDPVRVRRRRGAVPLRPPHPPPT